MADDPLQIKRYPNRRYYARHVKQYVSLEDIEGWIREGHMVEIRDSQTNDDLTRTVLTQLLIERHPEKIALFPADLLHFMLRANDLMADFLRNYFRDSLTYLNHLQQGGRTVPMPQPLHWMRAWMDNLAPAAASGFRPVAKPDPPPARPAAEDPVAEDPVAEDPVAEDDVADETGSRPEAMEMEVVMEMEKKQLARRVAELEERIRRLEAESPGEAASEQPAPEAGRGEH